MQTIVDVEASTIKKSFDKLHSVCVFLSPLQTSRPYHCNIAALTKPATQDERNIPPQSIQAPPKILHPLGVKICNTIDCVLRFLYSTHYSVTTTAIHSHPPTNDTAFVFPYLARTTQPNGLGLLPSKTLPASGGFRSFHRYTVFTANFVILER